MGGNHTHKALSQSVVKISCFSSLEFICLKTAKVKPRSRDSRITHIHTLTHSFWVPSLICCCATAICYGWSKHYDHQSGTCTEVLSSICPRPVICRETVMESWQIVCLLERVVFFPRPSISLLLSSVFAMHHSLLLSATVYWLPPCLIIFPRDGSNGWTSKYTETMETQHSSSCH